MEGEGKNIDGRRRKNGSRREEGECEREKVRNKNLSIICTMGKWETKNKKEREYKEKEEQDDNQQSKYWVRKELYEVWKQLRKNKKGIKLRPQR